MSYFGYDSGGFWTEWTSGWLALFLVAVTESFEYFVLAAGFGVAFTSAFVVKEKQTRATRGAASVASLLLMTVAVLCVFLHPLFDFYTNSIVPLHVYTWENGLKRLNITSTVMGSIVGIVASAALAFLLSDAPRFGLVALVTSAATVVAWSISNEKARAWWLLNVSPTAKVSDPSNFAVAEKLRAASPDFVILWIFNEAYMQEATVLLRSVERNAPGLRHRIVVAATDEASRIFAITHGLTRMDASEERREAGKLHDAPYLEFMRTKVRTIRKALDEFGVPVLYSDTDVVVMSDFSPDIAKFADVDAVFMDDRCTARGTYDLLCAGFALYRPTNAAKALLVKTEELMKHLKPGENDDQMALNYAVREASRLHVAKTAKFDACEFTNGCRAFWMKTCSPKAAKVLHNNWIDVPNGQTPTQAKLDRLQTELKVSTAVA